MSWTYVKLVTFQCNKYNVIRFSFGFHWLSCLNCKHRTCTLYGLVLVYSILVVTIFNQTQLPNKCGWDGGWKIWTMVGVFCISLPFVNHIEFLYSNCTLCSFVGQHNSSRMLWFFHIQFVIHFHDNMVHKASPHKFLNERIINN